MFLETCFVYPAPKYPEGDWETASLNCHDVFFSSADGTRLNGWYFPHPHARGQLLFCHGNGEHLGFLGEEMSTLRSQLQINLFAFDYRGYGRSEGRPFEAGVIADSEAAVNWLAQRANVSVRDIILMGRSLGGAVAVDLASRHGARGLILWNTFSSLPDTAARLLPWLPIRRLMRHRFDSVAKIPKYQGPLLQTHGTADRIVPFDLGQKLFAAATTLDKQFIAIPGGDHNDPPAAEFTAALLSFVDRVGVK